MKYAPVDEAYFVLGTIYKESICNKGLLIYLWDKRITFDNY